MANANGVENDIPDQICENIRKLLQDRGEAGYDIAVIGREYFAGYRTYLYPDRFGLKTWGDILTHPKLKSVCEIFNSAMSVRFRTTPLQSSPHATTPNATAAFGAGRGLKLASPQTPTSSIGSGTSGGYSRFGTPQTPESSVSSPKEKKLNRSDMETSSQISGSSLGKRSGSTNVSGTSSSKKKAMGNDRMEVESQTSTGTDFSERPVTISPHNMNKLSKERSKIIWIPREPPQGSTSLTFSTLILERTMRPEQPAMYIDCTYCDRQVLENLMDVKAHIKRCSSERFAEVRNRHNDFEFQKGAIFQHGAAIKMANIDALMGYALTSPKTREGSNLIQGNELLYFADIFGGPGGYAEYVLWKKKWHCKGFGITQRGKDDYDLRQAEHFPRESFETFYGESGLEGSGDILRPFNLAKFTRFVKDSTDDKGVHFAIATGGDRNDYVDEDQKEIRCKNTFLVELLCALQIVRHGGHYVTRVYDMYTPFTVGLIYLMYRTFDEVAVFKPESSLPASAEKYIICKWRKPDHMIREINNYLAECHKIIWLTKHNTRRVSNEEPADIVDLVSRERLRDSYRFCDYICRINSDLGRRQYSETSSLANSILNNSEDRYVDERLRIIQDKCLELWGIPSRTREKPKYTRATTPALRAMKLVTPYSLDFFSQTERDGQMELTKTVLKTELVHPKEWIFMPVGRERGFFLCLGGTKVYQFGGAVWTEISETVELMNNTLVYADLVDEIEEKGSKQSISTGFHIIDAMVLGGKDVRDLPYNERFDLITKYARSINKDSRDDLAAIRAKPHYELKFLERVLGKLKVNERLRNRDGDKRAAVLCPIDSHGTSGLVFHPLGMLFMKSFREQFAPADFRFSVQNRLFWRWTEDVDLAVPANLGQLANGNGNGVEVDSKESHAIPDAVDILRIINNAA